MILFYSVLFSTAAWGTGVLTFYLRKKHRVFLANLLPDAPENGWPSVTIVVAGRNEAARIEPALKSLLAIDYPALKIRAVGFQLKVVYGVGEVRVRFGLAIDRS